jgi:hypothetical protein
MTEHPATYTDLPHKLTECSVNDLLAWCFTNGVTAPLDDSRLHQAVHEAICADPASYQQWCDAYLPRPNVR